MEKTCYKLRKSRFFAEEEKALEERKGSKVKKRILTMVSGIQRRKEERRGKENGEVRGIPQRKNEGYSGEC